jgi:hypothetical protein
LEQDTHIASVTKDNTHLFEDRYEKLTEKDGELLYNWANDGEIPAVKPKIESQEVKKEPVENTDINEENEEIEVDIKTQITQKAQTLSEVNKKVFSKFIKDTLGFANYNKCDDDDPSLQVILDKVNEF